jgi:hypothetical protein
MRGFSSCGGFVTLPERCQQHHNSFCSFAENEDAANYVLCNILRQPNLLRFVMLYASDETTSRREPTFV